MALNPPAREAYEGLIRQAIAEDIGTGDVTTKATVAAEARGRGALWAKSDLVVSGLEIAAEVFRQLDPAVVVEVRWGDGAHVQAQEVIATITGRAAALLTGERTALNILQRLSGIATLTDKFVSAAAGRITVLDTRKTTPGWRALEKYAVRCGGGTNHRQRLDDGVLIKDNHKRLAGGVSAAVHAAQAAGHNVPVEVEVETIAEVDEALESGARRILLDNFTTYDIRIAMEHIGDRATVELSGGVTLARIPELATTGAQFVSVGALTHSASSADISFEIEPV